MNLDWTLLASVGTASLLLVSACDLSEKSDDLVVPGATSDTDDMDDPDGPDPEVPVDLCTDVDPEADASVTVDWSQWPQVPEEQRGDYETWVEFDALCTITDVDPSADPVVTELECDDDGTTRPLSFTLPGRDEPVAWEAGDEVLVEYHDLEYVWGYGTDRRDLIVRRAADGALLVASMNQESLYEETFAPVSLAIDEERCRPEDAIDIDDTWNLVIGFDNGRGETVELGNQQRGTLAPFEGEGVLAIDVGEARYGGAYCCHASRQVDVLVRRITGS